MTAIRLGALAACMLFYPVGTLTSAARRIRVNPSDGLRYVWVPGGTSLFGCSPSDHECFGWEKKARQVKVNGFWISATETTQRAFERVMGENPSLYRGAELPVDRASWNEADRYCRLTGMRLPTEIEWEFAARAGTTAARYGELDRIAWYDGNSRDRTHPVAGKRPNAYGLYDMLGNVWEWVQDDYETEPGKKILRGDSFYNLARQVRVSDRLWATPDTAHRDIGFRCAG